MKNRSSTLPHFVDCKCPHMRTTPNSLQPRGVHSVTHARLPYAKPTPHAIEAHAKNCNMKPLLPHGTSVTFDGSYGK